MSVVGITGEIAFTTVGLFVVFTVLFGMFLRRSLGWHRDPIKKRLAFDVDFLNPVALVLAFALAGGGVVIATKCFRDVTVFFQKK